MRQYTVCFFLRNNKEEILLALKKRGFAKGKYDGAGGKVELTDKTIEDAAIRECIEEVGLKPLEMKTIGTLTCTMFDQKNNGTTTVFICERFEGEPIETEEMKPFWFKRDEIPYESMWEDFKIWINNVFDTPTTLFNYHFYFDENDKLINYEKL